MDTTAVAEPTDAVEILPVMQVNEEEVKVKKGYEDETLEPVQAEAQADAGSEQADEAEDEKEDEEAEEDKEEDENEEGKDTPEA